MWKDSVGEQVALEEFTPVNNLMVRALLSCVFDDKGTPADRKVIIEDVVLRSFFMDSFYGDNIGTACAGPALR